MNQMSMQPPSGLIGSKGGHSSQVGGAQQQQTIQSQQEQSAADISLMLSLGLGLRTDQLANWDFKKLAMYLVSNS